jgi:hypothetical protein
VNNSQEQNPVVRTIAERKFTVTLVAYSNDEYPDYDRISQEVLDNCEGISGVVGVICRDIWDGDN